MSYDLFKSLNGVLRHAYDVVYVVSVSVEGGPIFPLAFFKISLGDFFHLILFCLVMKDTQSLTIISFISCCLLLLHYVWC